jgi:hypothetical protein
MTRIAYQSLAALAAIFLTVTMIGTIVAVPAASAQIAGGTALIAEMA